MRRRADNPIRRSSAFKPYATDRALRALLAAGAATQTPSPSPSFSRRRVPSVTAGARRRHPAFRARSLSTAVS
jgi:hypothetical protein